MFRCAINQAFGSGVTWGRGDCTRMKVEFVPLVQRKGTFPARYQILIHSLAPAFTSESALPAAPEARRSIKKVRRVDPHGSCFEPRRNLKSHTHILCPDRSRETVNCVVCQFHRLPSVPKTQRYDNGAENLLLRKSGRRFNITEKNRWIIEVLPGSNPARLPERCAVRLCLFDKTVSLSQLLCGNEGAEVGVSVQRVTNAQRLHPMAQIGEHFFVDAFLQEQPAPGTASLALTSPDSVHDPFNGAIEVC